MTPEQVGAFVDGAIPFFGGLWGTLSGFRKIGKPPGADPKVDEWHVRYGGMFRVVGPLLMLFGLWHMASPTLMPRQVEVSPMVESTLYPTEVGTAWVYQIDGGDVETRIAAHESLNGALVARLEVSQSGQVLRKTWIRTEASGVFGCGIDGRLRRPWFPLAHTGAPVDRKWEYRSENGKVVYQCEQSEGGAIKTPLGTFSRSIRVVMKGSDASGGNELHTWYVEGIGTVRELSKNADAEVLMELKAFRSPKVATASAAAARGRTLALEGKLEEALRDFDRSLELDGSVAQIWADRAVMRAARKDWKGVVEDTTEALRRDPASVQALRSRGSAYLWLENLPSGLADFDEAIRLAPAHPDTYRHRATIKARQGDLAGAIADNEKALKVAPSDWDQREDTRRRLVELRAGDQDKDGRNP